jgi:alkanesulfonate monooxygenase SsuD/methylene tetrahydromethanopterin reductase-like flavin-dependent oxidoreductase (luciferase family)
VSKRALNSEVKDKRRGMYANPTKVRDIDHDGKYFSVHDCHIYEPSPQRTPVLFQACASDRGTDFAAQHAESLFVIGANPRAAGDYAKTYPCEDGNLRPPGWSS